ncbi:YnbE family lipoprotein [Desulfopila inferna]|uniref:YnbE family lipoprotein n=1 Tax=Desulfopila inferna TaxID=468528 RepID=UPI001F05E7D6|nr:YnbE family lipoprotein [Desulfopila inferna]
MKCLLAPALFCGLLAMILSSAACTRHNVQVEPIEVKPIHITIDVNVRVDRALDDFFSDLDEVKAE